MNKLLLTSMLMISASLFSQSLFFTTGKNYTDYDFKMSLNTQDKEFSSGSGNFYEVGYTRPINTKKTLRHSISINLNEYNSNSGNLATSYAWEADYLGLKNHLEFDLFTFFKSLKLSANYSFTIQKFVNGQQRINGQIFNLKNYKDFNGLFLNNSFGGSLSYSIQSNMGIAVGYDFSKSISLNRKGSTQCIAFRNQQIYFKFVFSYKKIKSIKSDNLF